MKWVKRTLKCIGLLLALLLVAALAFREWCVWRLPSMEREVDAAWKDYAGVAFSEIPQRFPSVETNDAALKLEAAAAKLGICLAPVETGKTDCPRNAPSDEARKEFEALTTKNAKGEPHPVLTDYLNSQMERPDPVIDPPPAALQDYLDAHQLDISEIVALLNQPEMPRWGYQTQAGRLANAPNLLGILTLYKQLAVSALQGQYPERLIPTFRAMENFEAAIIQQPNDVVLLIAIAEHRILAAVGRKMPASAAGLSGSIHTPDWNHAYRLAQAYTSWVFTSREAVIYFESVSGDDDDPGGSGAQSHVSGVRRLFNRKEIDAR